MCKKHMLVQGRTAASWIPGFILRQREAGHTIDTPLVLHRSAIADLTLNHPLILRFESCRPENTTSRHCLIACLAKRYCLVAFLMVWYSKVWHGGTT